MKTSFILFIVTNCAKMASYIHKAIITARLYEARKHRLAVYFATLLHIYTILYWWLCICVRACLRSIFGSVRTQFIWNNLCQQNLIRPMNTWTFFLVNSKMPVVYVCGLSSYDSTIFRSFHFWQTIKSMKICLIWWQIMMVHCWRVTDYHKDDNSVMMFMREEEKTLKESRNYPIFIRFLSLPFFPFSRCCLLLT